MVTGHQAFRLGKRETETERGRDRERERENCDARQKKQKNLLLVMSNYYQALRESWKDRLSYTLIDKDLQLMSV